MEASQLVNIDFKKMTATFGQFVREKAKAAGSTIVYQSGNNIVEEDPTTGIITILKTSVHQ